jgi:hypothetical protein
MSTPRPFVFCLTVALCSLVAAPPAEAQPAANSDPTYQQLRSIQMGGESVAVQDVKLTREGGVFHLKSGSVCFLAPVEGRVTGAVFVGEGTFFLRPQEAHERRSLAQLSRSSDGSLEEDYRELVLRFSDQTYEEIKGMAGVSEGGSAACAAGPLNEIQQALRRRIKYNLAARILQDVKSGNEGLFVAFIKGRRHNSKLVFAIDPHGAPSVAPEEVSLSTWDENKRGIWAAFHAQDSAQGVNNALINVQRQKLDLELERNGRLNGSAETVFTALYDGVHAAPFNLYATLRVEKVSDAASQPLAFIQEDKDDDAQFWVILPRSLKAGESFTVRTEYSGRDAVNDEGGGNYFIAGGARGSWYPAGLAWDYSAFEMIFRIPKGMKMIATAELLREYDEGRHNISEWRTQVPQGVAGFNVGRFRRREGKAADMLVESYANSFPSNHIRSIQRAATPGLQRAPGADPTAASQVGVPIGNLNTSSFMQKALAEAQLSVALYTEYFGSLPYSRLAITHQDNCSYGQAWPGLVWLPVCSFFSSTQRQLLGAGNHDYYRVVNPHEVAHQWWGHMVGWKSYRDQWMTEGFAHLSASLYIELIEKNPREFIRFWERQRELLLEANRYGNRPIDVGPLTMGYRLSNDVAGFDIYSRLIYPKGAYVLHMLRMLMHENRTGDARFKAMMQDFVSTHANSAASTEDFKAVVEKHMTPEMDLDANRRMDWFFNQYVYGTALPEYSVSHAFEPAGDGILMKLKVTQSGVDPNFRMLVPLYLELADGRIARLGVLRLVGNQTHEQDVPLAGVTQLPRRALVNYYMDVLSK